MSKSHSNIFFSTICSLFHQFLISLVSSTAINPLRFYSQKSLNQLVAYLKTTNNNFLNATSLHLTQFPMPFYDFSLIKSTDEKTNADLMLQMAKLGYDGIAWNLVVDQLPQIKQLPANLTHPIEAGSPLVTELIQQTYHSDVFHTSMASTKAFVSPVTFSQVDLLQQQRLVELSTALQNPTDATQQLQPPPHKAPPLPVHFQQLSRITLNMSDMSSAQQLTYSQTSPLSKFDIIAVNPGCDKVLHHCLFNDLVDIITFDLSKRLPFLLKPQHIRMAKDKGIFYEIDCSPIHSTDAQTRRTFLSQLQQFFFITRGKQLIFTNNSTSITQCKTPSDLINFMVAMGFPSFPHLVDSFSTNMEHVIMHLKTRLTLKAVTEAHLVFPKLLKQRQEQDQSRQEKKQHNSHNNNNNNNKNNNGDKGRDNKRPNNQHNQSGDNKSKADWKKQKVGQ